LIPAWKALVFQGGDGSTSEEGFDIIAGTSSGGTNGAIYAMF